jgi:hypothetical protein
MLTTAMTPRGMLRSLVNTPSRVEPEGSSVTSDEEWIREQAAMDEAAYLATEDARAQSGFRGDAARWEAARRVIAAGIDRDGTFLDIGCANGLLMKTMVAWAAADGHQIEPYGLDISERLVALARDRLPHWADRFYIGNALTWEPPAGMPRRFDFARTELVYVPEGRYRDYVAHLLDRVVAPGGRLLVCSYGSSRRPAPRVEPIDDWLRDWGFSVAGIAEAADPENGIIITRVAFVENRVLGTKC